MWFTKSTEQVIAESGVDPSKGLSNEEVKIRLEKYGANRLLAKKKKSLLQLLFTQLQDWLIYILFAAVVITLFLGEYVDAIIIILVICTNAILGVIQEVKAEKAIEALQLAVIGIPFMQRAFHLQMPDLKAWIMAIVLGLIPLAFSEIFKLFKRHSIRAAGK
jgi:magnesium-transporting ATPase (P-type)